MKLHRSIFVAALGAALTVAAVAQVPAAPLTAPLQTGNLATHRSKVNAAIYGPQGELHAITLRDGIAVSLPSDLGQQLRTSVLRGARVQVSGTQQVIAGQTNLIAQSLTIGGQTYTATAIQPPQPGAGVAGIAPPPPPPPTPGPAGPPPPRGPRAWRGSGGPPPPPNGAAPPPSPDGVAAPPPPAPNGTAPPPPPDGTATPPPDGAPAPPPANAVNPPAPAPPQL